MSSSMVAIKVTTTSAGASAEATETGVTVPLEKALVRLPGFHKLLSTSAQGVSTIWLQFKDINSQEALRMVQLQVASIALGLPDGVSGSLVIESSYPQEQ
jgi:multidrug efflux pump subunit AcrB